MQTIFPLFLAFLLTLLLYLNEPLSRKRALWLALVSALTFYIYNFLALIVFLALMYTFFWFLASKQFKELRALVMTGLYTGLLLIPFSMYTLMQMQGPLYDETIARLGLVYTHIPALEAFFYGRWIVIGLLLVALLWFFFERGVYARTPQRVLWVGTGGAMFTGLFMNVITGVEITLAIHVGRFVMVWMVLLLGVVLYEWYMSRTTTLSKRILGAHVMIGILILFLVLGTIRNIPRALAFFEFDNRGYKLKELEEYGAPLSWLEENVGEESVIWSNISFGSYVPIMTKHYTLFHSAAVLHNISAKELEERYLLWRSLSSTTIDDLKRDFEYYAGAGRIKELPLAHNNQVLFCETLSRFKDIGECGERTDAIKLQGEAYFEQLYAQYEAVKKNQINLIAKYQIAYLVVDTLHDKLLDSLATSSIVYQDRRFIIFRVWDMFKSTRISPLIGESL